MPLYETIPEPVDAVQWTSSFSCLLGEDWLLGYKIEGDDLRLPPPYDESIAKIGDWIVKHGDGIAVISDENFQRKFREP